MLRRLLKIAVFLIPCAASLGAADLQEIIRRGTAAIQSDWAADTDYAYIERNEVQKSGPPTSETYRVVEVEGSDYKLAIAISNRPLPPDRQKLELRKFGDEVRRRKAEDPAARERRVAKYQKQRRENGALLLDFPDAFNFELAGEETMNGHPAFVLSAMPKKRTGSLSLAARVLAGMQGTLWLGKENFHVVRVECDAVKPIPVFGILARVLPGTLSWR